MQIPAIIYRKSVKFYFLLSRHKLNVASRNSSRKIINFHVEKFTFYFKGFLKIWILPFSPITVVYTSTFSLVCVIRHCESKNKRRIIQVGGIFSFYISKRELEVFLWYFLLVLLRCNFGVVLNYNLWLSKYI